MNVYIYLIGFIMIITGYFYVSWLDKRNSKREDDKQKPKE